MQGDREGSGCMDSNPFPPLYTGGARQPELDRYPYMNDLLAMERMVPLAGVSLPTAAVTITTPLCWEAWARELQSHLDEAYAT